jgi:hypothetical protein
MTNKALYQILGLAYNATEEEIKKAYRDSVTTCFEKNGSIQEFYDISNAYITLTNLSTSLMIPDSGVEIPELIKNPGWGSLMEKSISPAFMLSIMFTGIAGGLIGYSLQPKQTVVREIIREAQVPNATPTPVPSPDREGPKEQPSTSQPAMVKEPSKIAIAPNHKPSSQKITAQTNANTARLSTEQSIPTLPNIAKPFRILPVPPQALPTIQQQPAGILPGKPVLVPAPQSPKLLPLDPASTQSFPSAKFPGQTPIQKSAPNISNPTEAPGKDEEADRLIAQIDAYKPTQQSPQAPGNEPRKQSTLTTPSTSTIARVSPEKILGSIPIPMEDGTSVPANKLLHLDTEVWKLDKGETRKKLGILVNELIESKNLNSACTKADISLEGLRLLIKKYGTA